MGRYKVYDPLKSKRMNLPESKGCYLITLRSGASFISCGLKKDPTISYLIFNIFLPPFF